MGLIGTLLRFVRGTVDDAEVSEATIDPGGDANLTAQHFGAPGDDSHPLAGDYVAVAESPGTGNVHVTGYLDPANAGQAAAGEKRLYSRDGDGAPIAVIWLKADGTIEIRNDNGSIELAAGGDVMINGVVIDTSGNVTAPGEVTAKDGPNSVGLSTHLHATAMGPSDPPTPGT